MALLSFFLSLLPPPLIFGSPILALSHLFSSCPNRLERMNGALLVAGVLWEGRNKEARTMRLTKKMALHFVRALGKGINPVTLVCKSWGCKLLAKGSNINGNKTNIWSYPPWANGQTVRLPVSLTPYQVKRWKNRQNILIECADKAHPASAAVRKTLALTTESDAFKVAAAALTEPGKRVTVQSFRRSPTKITNTGDGDILSPVARLPEALRALLLIDGRSVAEFDIKSAHAVMLGIFYEGETEDEWVAERERFIAEGVAGFTAIYGHNKEHKKGYLAGLNQSATVARHASHGYREFERLFPLLAGKVAQIRWRNPKALGSILRHRLAIILRELVVENHADGIRSIPVTDSAVVAMPGDFHGKHRASFRTAWRLGVPLTKQTGVPALIEGSDGENYRFFLSNVGTQSPNEAHERQHAPAAIPTPVGK